MTVLTRLRPDDAPGEGPADRAAPNDRYRAFLSYSHRDEKLAGWLHERLERFRVPPALIGRDLGRGEIPRRLRPVFRDRHELAAAGDLGAGIEAALAASPTLIVLCSPAAAASRWVNAEIERFHRVRPAGQVLAAIIEGDPFAADPAEECFPPALKVQYDKRGRATLNRAEPIAADLREGKDGRRVGLLKVVAGMLGVGLDELVKREAARRQRRMAIITSASIAGMALTSGLALMAIQSRDAARDQRREAEGLVGFMIGDLRTRLEPLGRLDVLDVVGEKALGYYRKQDKGSLSDDSLAQRSRALTMIGEIAAKRGHMDGALQRYQEALAGTAEALRRAPGDPQRLFDHAQSVYWVGSIALERGRIDEAAARFEEYRGLADRMIAADPANPKWRLEGIYAATNLGTVELQQQRYPAAVATFAASLNAATALASAKPRDDEYRKLLIEALSYLSGAYDKAGRIESAIAGRERQLALIAPGLAEARPDEELRQKAMIANMAISRLLYQQGKTVEALVHAAAASEIGERLVAVEPTNADWQGRSAGARLNQAMLLLRAGKAGEAATATNSGCATATRLIARDPTIVSWQDSARQCLMLRAELAVAGGNKAAALALARQLASQVASEQRAAASPNPFASTEARKLVGDMLWRSGDRVGAQAEWRAALAAWPKAAETPIQFGERGEMLRGIGDRAGGRAIAERLVAMGYRQSISNRARV